MPESHENYKPYPTPRYETDEQADLQQRLLRKKPVEIVDMQLNPPSPALRGHLAETALSGAEEQLKVNPVEQAQPEVQKRGLRNKLMGGIAALGSGIRQRLNSFTNPQRSGGGLEEIGLAPRHEEEITITVPAPAGRHADLAPDDAREFTGSFTKEELAAMQQQVARGRHAKPASEDHEDDGANHPVDV